MSKTSAQQFSIKMNNEDYLAFAYMANLHAVGVGTLGRMVIHNWLRDPAQAEMLKNASPELLEKFKPKKRSTDQTVVDPNQMEIKE